MTWHKCSDKLPDREGDILVKINGCLFLGKSLGTSFYLPDFINMNIQYHLPIVELKIAGKWSIPKHFLEPDEWMYVP